jgi:regulator of protease activity HflC (stomatin/prohibitin superfamily)
MINIDNSADKIMQIKAWFRANVLTISVILIVALATLIVLWRVIVHAIPAGGVGVLYRPLANGVDTALTLEEGVHFIWPWNSITQYSIQVQKKEIAIEVLTKDLLKTKATVSFQYQLDPKTVGFLHKYVGPEFIDKIVLPQVVQITRQIVGKTTSQEAFTTSLTSVADDISIDANESIINSIQPAGLVKLHLIHIDSVQITNISFPKAVEEAIELKVTEQAKAEALTFVVQGAKKEAERKAIEAGGIRDFQQTVSGGLTENYLKYRGIEASTKLAESNNAKIVIFGSGQAGLPLVFDDFKNQTNKK